VATESAIVGIHTVCGDAGVTLIEGARSLGLLHSPFGDSPDDLGREI
jgi:hypothetical protein